MKINPIHDRSFRPVSMKDGKCPNEEWHFFGIAREVYSYLKFLAALHGGFIFATVPNIARHTKQWKKNKKAGSIRQVNRVLRTFEALGVLGERCQRTIHGRRYWGRQFGSHDFWAMEYGDICDFKYWESYLSHSQATSKRNVTTDVMANDTADVARKRPNVMADVMADVTRPGDIIVVTR